MWMPRRRARTAGGRSAAQPPHQRHPRHDRALTQEPRPLLALPASQHRLEHHTGRIKGNNTLSHFQMRRTRQISHPGHRHPRCVKCNIVAAAQDRRSHPGKDVKHGTRHPRKNPHYKGKKQLRPQHPVLHLMQHGLKLEPRCPPRPGVPGATPGGGELADDE